MLPIVGPGVPPLTLEGLVMKHLLVAVAFVLSSSAARAVEPAQDPNVVAAGSFASGTSSIALPVDALPVLSPVPEADALGLLAAGVAVAGALAWRRRR